MSLKNSLDNFLKEATNLITRIRSRDLLELTVRSREEILFAGQVRAIVSKNALGVFSVLPQHANFITLIEERLQIVKPSYEKLTFSVRTGLLKVWENQADVFLDVLAPIKIGRETN